MLKAIWCATRNPEVSLAEFSQHWFEVHGQLHIQPGHRLLGYDQHHTLYHAHEGLPKPTHDGASIVWLKDRAAYNEALKTKAFEEAGADGNAGVRGHTALLGWPLGFAMGLEKVIIEGDTHPLMVKIIHVARRHPDVPIDDFFARWLEAGAAVGQTPGARRYVQNHGIPDAPGFDEPPYDGWSEMWFDTLEALQAATDSEPWRRAGEMCQSLFDERQCWIIGRARHILPPVRNPAP